MSQEVRTLKLRDLVLWTENPRDPFDKTATDQDIVDRALTDKLSKWNLSQLVKQMGRRYDFSELPTVVFHGNKPVVYDGNRRIEHLALETLREAGVSAATSRILDHGAQRFLEVERFDRVGHLGQRAVISLAALDAEFVGGGAGPWPVIARRFAADGQTRRDAVEVVDLLWVFGTLLGNTDTHSGNLSSSPTRGGLIASPLPTT